MCLTSSVSGLKLKPLPRWRGRAIARPGSGDPRPRGRSLPGGLPQGACQLKQDAIFYVYARTRKIGRAAQTAKLPEGMATSSMMFLMVNRRRSCSKEPTRSSQKKAGASTLNVKTPWADQAAKCCRTANPAYERPTASSTTSQSRILSERAPALASS